MKIAMIVPSLRQLGPVNVAYDLVNLLVQHGHECRVFYFDEFLEKIHSFPCGMERISMERSINFSAYDVVHTHGIRPAKYVSKHRSQYNSSKFVTTIHNYVFQDFKYQYGWVKALVGGLYFIHVTRAHDRIVCLSRDAMNYYAKWFPINKLTYAYNTRCISDEVLSEGELREIKNFSKGGTVVAITCELIARKGVDLLIKSIARLPKKFRAVVIGDGALRPELEQMTVELKLSDRILFLGYKRNAYRYLPYVDIFALTSYSEGFPLALIEAAAYGKKIVCTDLPILKETFTDKEVVFFNKGDVCGLADALILADSCNSLQTNIKSKYEQEYSPERFYTRYINIYKSI